MVSSGLVSCGTRCSPSTCTKTALVARLVLVDLAVDVLEMARPRLGPAGDLPDDVPERDEWHGHLSLASHDVRGWLGGATERCSRTRGAAVEFDKIDQAGSYAPRVLERPLPRIVNMSSDMGSLTLRTGPLLAAYAPSTSMLNSIAAQYARASSDTSVIVNAACSGYVATGFNGPRTAEQGAAVAVRLATLPDDGPRGGLFDGEGPRSGWPSSYRLHETCSPAGYVRTTTGTIIGRRRWVSLTQRPSRRRMTCWSW